jgi:uncharacterized membrane protein
VNSSPRLILALALLLAGGHDLALGQTPQYSVTNLGPVQGASLNDKGQVAGYESVPTPVPAATAVVWDAVNGVQDLGIPPGFVWAQSTAINNLGHVAGVAGVSVAGPYGLFYWDSTRGFLVPGISVSSAFSISDTDLIAGWATDAFLWGPANGLQYLPVPCPGVSSQAMAISSNGAFVVGDATVHSPQCNPLGQFYVEVPVMWTAGILTELNVNYVVDVNNVGQVAGNVCQPGGLAPCYAAVWTNGVVQDLGTLPGASIGTAYSINDSGQVIGDSGNSVFVWDSKNGMRDLNSLIPTGSGIILTHAIKINNSGQILATGSSGPLGYTFLLTPPAPQLIDPVPSLLGALANLNLGGLATGGNVVKGVAADGVSEVVVRIPATNVGDQFTLTLLNDQGQSSASSSDDGGLGVVGQQTVSSQITTSAVSTPSGPMAFAFYLAPTDFPRTSPPTITCGGVTATDPQLACRFVTIQVQGPSGSPTPLPVTILRPPVVLIHGLWSDQSSWNNFLPLFGNGVVDSRFSVDRADYSYSVGSQISSYSPPYPQALSRQIANAKANSLGFQYNASGSLGILSQVQSSIQRFKNGSNPAAVPVAAVQADIVAHSMGGNITRTLPLQQSFLSSNTFGQGPIHKVITINTPHLGTPLATQLLSGNGCVGDLLASQGQIAFDNVTLNGRTVTGAVGDLIGDGFGGAMSPWLQNIANPGPHPLPMAVIAGVLNSANLGTLTTNQIAGTIRGICGVLFKNPLAVNLTPLGWPMEFGQPSDAIVPLSSQLNNLSTCTGCQSFGFVHSGGAEILGFSGPSVLPTPSDLSQFPSLVNQIPNQVIGLLNTPVTDPVFNLVNP